jgi:ABC-type multidrug transport system fused ATPase/permease subunit
MKEAIPAHSMPGNIEFKNVWFAYDADQYVLKDISFEDRCRKNHCNCWPYGQW